MNSGKRCKMNRELSIKERRFAFSVVIYSLLLQENMDELKAKMEFSKTRKYCSKNVNYDKRIRLVKKK